MDVNNLTDLDDDTQEVIDIYLSLVKIVVLILTGYVFTCYVENLRFPFLEPFLIGVVVAAILCSVLDIILNLTSLVFKSLKLVRRGMTEVISVGAFLLWALVQSQNDSGIIMLYGSGFFFFGRLMVLLGNRTRNAVRLELIRRGDVTSPNSAWSGGVLQHR